MNKNIIGFLLVLGLLTVTLGCSTELNEADLQKAREYYNKGLNLMLQNKYDEAIEEFDKTLKIDPNYKEAWNNKGIALGTLGKFSEAIVAFDKAIAIDPNYKAAWYVKGLVLEDLGRSAEAKVCFDKVKELG